MSRKHFRAIAEQISKLADKQERERMAREMASVCAAQNPRFDRQRFLSACNAL